MVDGSLLGATEATFEGIFDGWTLGDNAGFEQVKIIDGCILGTTDGAEQLGKIINTTNLIVSVLKLSTLTDVLSLFTSSFIINRPSKLLLSRKITVSLTVS